jgi:short-subunit dehydrogenase
VYDKGIDITIVCPGYIKTNVSINAVTANGEKHGVMDTNQEEGMSVADCAKKIIHAIASKKEEVIMGGKEKYGVYIKRFFPKYFSKMMKKRKII